MNLQPSDILDLIRACVSGDLEARQQFQDEHGEDIYNFPVKVYGLPAEKAGDFYVYVFDKDRIFNRIKTFAGRNNIQFRTFLSYYVLKHLFLEWQRTVKEIETVSLNSPRSSWEEGESTLEDRLPAPPLPGTEPRETLDKDSTSEVWKILNPEEQLQLKLLCLIECDLDAANIRLLAELSGRSLRETLLLLTEVQEGLKRKDEKLSHLHDELDSIWGWILLRQKEMQEIDEKIRLLMADRESAPTLQKLRYQRQAVEHALVKRYRQREKIMEEIRSGKLTTPYRDIARLLNTTVGTVCSRIFRLRERLTRAFAESKSGKETL